MLAGDALDGVTLKIMFLISTGFQSRDSRIKCRQRVEVDLFIMEFGKV